MNKNKKLDDLAAMFYEEYKRSWSEENYYEGISYLGDLLAVIPSLEKRLEMEWLDKLRQIQIDADTFWQLEKHAKGAFAHINRILSTQSTLIYENLVLVMTGRDELERVIVFLRDIQSFDLGISLLEIDDKLTAIERIPRVRDELLSARRSIRRNARFYTL